MPNKKSLLTQSNMTFNKKFRIIGFCIAFFSISIGIVLSQYLFKPKAVIQNNKNDVLYGETLYPKQIKAVLAKYKDKYNIDVKFAKTKKEFIDILNKTPITDKPFAIFQYNEGHKYGFIFVKYNQTNYCVCIDTIPSLSEYVKNGEIKEENGYLIVHFKGTQTDYVGIMFGKNLQKAMKGCGSFTIAIIKQLLKNNATYLFELLRIYEKNKPNTSNDDKKSIVRGIDFEIVKNTEFAPEIYKYAQNMSLQAEFDEKLVGNKQRKMNNYRKIFSANKVNSQGENKVISTKVFQITQKYKDAPLKEPANMNAYGNLLVMNK